MESMKKKISVSLEKETIKWLDDQAATGKYRNRSHAIEFAVQELMKQTFEAKQSSEAKP